MSEFGRREFMAGAAAAGLVQREVRPAEGTREIQRAIDECSRAGGGTVRFQAGRYVSGTLVLKDRVTLELEAGAVLAGSTRLEDYPSHVPAMRSYTDTYTEKSLIYAEGAERIGITGRGTIDGQGAAFKGPYKVRPYLMRFIECRDVSIAGVTIRDSPMWVQHYLGCEGVEIRGVTVHSRVNANNDGIDIDCSRRVRISGCDISSGDDAIVLKSTSDRVCRDVTVTNCVLSTACNALKMGTESNGGFENITISNCTIYDTRLAGIALEMVDGGLLDRVAISNIVMDGVGAPIFMRLGNRARPFREGGPAPGVGRMRNITISNLEAVRAAKTGCAVCGLPGHHIENVSIENARLRFDGGGTRADAAREAPEVPEKYPEHNMFGTLPAYGLFCRHVRNLNLRGVETAFEARDERPAVVCDDVDGLEIASARLSGVLPLRFARVRNALIHGCRAVDEVAAFLEVRDRDTGPVSLVGNDLGKAKIDVIEPERRVFRAANRESGR